MTDDYVAIQQRAAVAYYNALRTSLKADAALTAASRAKVDAQQELWKAEKAFVEAAIVKMDPPPADGHARTRSDSYIIENCVVSNHARRAECRDMMRLNP